MLRLDLKPGESVRIGTFATITLEEKSGKSARIAFHADRSVPITRVPAEDKADPTRGIAGAFAPA
jgi:sRNA-binding carbon storage regulator CsrA